MSRDERSDVLIVLHRPDGPAPRSDEHRLRLPDGADLADLLRELERESPALHAEIRGRILRAAGRVLAYGKEDKLVPALTRQLADGGPVVFPAEDPADSSAVPAAD